MKQLKPQDAQFLFMEDGHIASHVTSVMICDQSSAPGGTVRFKDILSIVEERLGASPLYSQKLMRLPFDVDFPYWVEDPYFELEYHVRHSRLPEPSDWRQLCIQIARRHSRPLDMNRPPWEMDVIAGLDNVEGVAKGSFAVVMKMHHSAVDGTSAQQFMFSMMDFGPEGPPLIPAPRGRALVRETAVSAPEVMTRAAINNATSPVKLARAAVKLTPTLAKLAARRARGKKDETASIPVTRFNGEISPNRAFDAVTFPLDEFKQVARAFPDTKINDVVLGVVSGALRTYLESKNELPDQPLVITAPVNKRASGSDAIKGEEGNNISAMSVPIFTNIPNAADRLKSISIAAQSAKAAKSGLGARIATDLTKHVPSFALANLGPLLINSGMANEQTGNAIVSNVAGVNFPIYFAGALVTDAYALAPIGAGMGLFIATPSYNGKITFNVTTTRQIMPDTPFFMNCLRGALEELKTLAARKAARASGGKKAGPRAKKTYHRTRSASEVAADAKPAAKAKPKPRVAAAKTKAPAKAKSKAPAKAKPKRKTAAKPKANGSAAKANGAAKPARKTKAAATRKKANGASRPRAS